MSIIETYRLGSFSTWKTNNRVKNLQKIEPKSLSTTYFCVSLTLVVVAYGSPCDDFQNRRYPNQSAYVE